MKTISCMKIDNQLLGAYSAEVRKYDEKEIIFSEGDFPSYYYQITEGAIKINNYNEDGKEFIHNILGKDQSFGDPLLFMDKTYPMNASALKPSTVIRLPRKNFINLIKENPQISLDMNACLSHRLYYKMIMMQSMASQNPSARIIGLFDYLKSYSDCDDHHSFQILMTRQQIADLTGLRVETIIRTIKKMESEGFIKIKDRKIYY
ncbi:MULTISPECIES: Crp/Fnr family transcriptional regulator [Chryseobacterium]|uniref:Nitrogen-responsive regulatory protein n=1 Tax=Chryseobacterium taihuense TaxID=1141221 RepID=A0A1G9NUG5_9FLAO|nr:MULTISPECIES: Crp/Fnr family transcriptional regulator [Chryseobacterium]SDL90039.1 cAMP-binding domain of CRP or a regulatory subunit of cAMP-dependent protein kinases [Chryseobacterium taihuense]VFB02587.1 Nitrogen-responsive regulatory protein [Chryseobacterium taihuense]